MKSYNDILKEVRLDTIQAQKPTLVSDPSLMEMWEELTKKYQSSEIDKAKFLSDMLPKKAKDSEIIDQLLNIITDCLQEVILEEEMGQFETISTAIKTFKKQQRILLANKTETKVAETALFFLLNQLTKQYDGK